MTGDGTVDGPRPLDGKVVVLTGSLRRLSRDQAEGPRHPPRAGA